MKMGKKYAICDDCHHEMIKGGGCTYHKYIVDNEGKIYKRVPYDPYYNGMYLGSCHDCNAGRGKIHHYGCDMERCPKCDGQIISCGCEFIKFQITKKY